MMSLMILIEELKLSENTKACFYKGVDFDILINHSKDGSKGFIFCFIDSWQREVDSYNRNNKIKSLLNSTSFNEFDWKSIDNNFISIYQTEGVGYEVVYETVKKKIINQQLPDQPWIPINGTSTGTWKIK